MKETLKAPKGKYRVVGYDSFDHQEYLLGIFDSKEEAVSKARQEGGTMNKAYVYDENTLIAEFGTF